MRHQSHDSIRGEPLAGEVGRKQNDSSSAEGIIIWPQL